MRKNRGWAALRTALSAAALVGLVASQSLAASSTSDVAAPTGIKNTFTYSTSGQVDPTTGVSSEGVTGINVVSFDSVGLNTDGQATNSFVTPTSFSLGAFRVSALPSGQSTTYANTPFSITFLPQSINGATVSNVTPVLLKGVLNGTVTGNGQSDLVATFLPTEATDPNSAYAVGFTTDTDGNTYANTLRILSEKVALVPSTSNGGLTTVQGQVISSGSPIPEPTTIVLFASAVAGLGLRHRLRRKAG